MGQTAEGDAYEDKEKHHWREKIAENKGNSKKLWQTMSSIMGEKPGGRCDDSDCTADDFAKFFSDKVDSIRSATSGTPPHVSADTASHVINEWKSVTVLEVENLISSSLPVGPSTYMADQGVTQSPVTVHCSAL